MNIILHNNILKVFNDGTILVKRNGEFYEKKYVDGRGYNRLHLSFNGKLKKYAVHRIIAYTYLGLDIENPKQIIDHIDRNKKNNNVTNLRVVTNQENMFNTNAKGYTWNKRKKKFQAQICVNGKKIHLGYFDKEEDAREAYLNAKQIHHIFFRNPILIETLPPLCSLNGTSSEFLNL